MKHVYVGKPYKTGYEICRVIDSCIETGAALVYNRNTKAVEVLPWGGKIRISEQEHKWLNDHEEEFEADFLRACKKYAEFIKAFQAA